MTVLCGITMQKLCEQIHVSRVQLQFTPPCDGFTELASSININCCHLESILSVSSKTFDDGTSGHY